MGQLIVVLPDVHMEADTPLHPSYQVVKKFVKAKRPDRIILLGDFMDMGCLSHHNKNKPLLFEGKRYGNDITATKTELTELRQYCGAMDYLEGNHEYWLTRYLEEHSVLSGKLSLPQDLGLEDLGIRWVPFNDVLSVGKLNFIHGWYTNKYHASKHLDVMGDHVFYGHTHDHQVMVRPVRAKRQPYIAMSLGCLCDLNPHYRRNRPGEWLNGFGIFEVREDGNFTPVFVPIVGGRFSYGGEVWE